MILVITSHIFSLVTFSSRTWYQVSLATKGTCIPNVSRASWMQAMAVRLGWAERTAGSW